eukprot:SM000058S18549  [mRNA]  locus=s58:517744:519140:+ [translate_table: standard]
MLETSCLGREHAQLKEIRDATASHPRAFMQSAPDETQLLQLLLKLMGARRTIEVGVFTGYSLLATALALPEDGKVIALDITRDFYEIGKPFIEKAGMADKIDFRKGPAVLSLDTILAEEGAEGSFDFAYIDADKANYSKYYERCLRLVRVGGLVAVDNTLWSGQVVGDRYQDPDTVEIKDLNKLIGWDRRVEISMLAISDGLTLCRRIK